MSRKNTNGVRKDYLLKLVNSLKKQIEEDPETVKAKEELGEDVIIPKWANASFLCSVVEQEVIGNENIPSVTQEEYRDQVVDPYQREMKEMLNCIDGLLSLIANNCLMDGKDEMIKKAYEILWRFEDYG